MNPDLVNNEPRVKRRMTKIQSDDFAFPSSHANDGSIDAYITQNNESSGILQVLRRKILLDLERHFGRKVDHDKLIPCLSKYLSSILHNK